MRRLLRALPCSICRAATTSVFRLLLPLAPAAWALPALVRGRRGRAALLLGGVVGQLVWISWVWDLGSVAIRWVP